MVYSRSREELIFRGMRQRCTNPKNKQFRIYGGRGIQCKFTSYHQLVDAIGRRPSPSHSVDRIDTNGHYELGNVRWATSVQQNRNSRNNHYITVNGVTKLLVDWMREVDGAPSRISARIHRGWCEQCAVTIPSRGGMCPHRQERSHAGA